MAEEGRGEQAGGVFEAQPVSTRSAASQIADQIRKGIAEGRLKLGERLPSEHELAADFGVSRATVREAVKILATGGLVQATRGAGGGTFVTLPQTGTLAISLGEVLALWFHAGKASLVQVEESRAWVERGCVRLAAERRTNEDLKEIERCVDQGADRNLTIDQFLALDLEFHVAISKAAKNPVLDLSMTAIHLVRPWTNTLVVPVLDRDKIVAQHRQIFEAIDRRDTDGAEQALLDHLGYLADLQENALASRDASDIEIAALTGESHPAVAQLEDRLLSEDDQIER